VIEVVPYFIILPAFVLYVIAMVTALVVTWLYRPASAYRRYILSVLLWSSAGFVLSTIVYAVMLVVSVRAMDQLLDGQPSVVGGVAMGGMVFVGPFVSSVVGLAGGAAFGLWRTRSMERQAA
jgi:hypothetical protein